MSIFENENYDHDYQRYLDWKDEQEQLEKECEDYLQGEQEEVETTGERCVREAQQEEDVRQLAQVYVGGVYRYELEWLPETQEIRVEVDQFRDGLPMYYWYPDKEGTIDVLSRLLNVSEDKIRITGLKFFTPDRVIDDVFEHERLQFLKSTWRDYAEDGIAMQFNVEMVCPNNCYDAACDGTNCEFKRQVIHGIDGTQCDCSVCTFDYGFCSCGCRGNAIEHAKWLEEREKQVEEVLHETVMPPVEIEKEEEEDAESVESVEEKENRMWSDFKLAMMSSFLALMLGMYICRVLGC